MNPSVFQFSNERLHSHGLPISPGGPVAKSRSEPRYPGAPGSICLQVQDKCYIVLATPYLEGGDMKMMVLEISLRKHRLSKAWGAP